MGLARRSIQLRSDSGHLFDHTSTNCIYHPEVLAVAAGQPTARPRQEHTEVWTKHSCETYVSGNFWRADECVVRGLRKHDDFIIENLMILYRKLDDFIIKQDVEADTVDYRVADVYGYTVNRTDKETCEYNPSGEIYVYIYQ